MPLNDAALDIAGEAIASAVTHVQAFTAVPNAGGTNGIGARAPIDLVSTDGDLSLATPVALTGLGASVAVGYFGLFTAATGGAFLGYATRTTGDDEANAAGEYTLQSLSIPASSS